jgi:ketosteroid isomerase-like protein
MKTHSSTALLLLLLFAFTARPAGAQQVQALESIHSQAELDKTIAALDSAFFDAYNRCDLAKFKDYLADDLEFYHDQQAQVLGKDSIADMLKNYVCGKVTRALVPGTLQTHQMTGYGALVMGVHRFYPTASGSAEPPVEEKFIELWRFKDGAWKIARVVNYDHRSSAN